MLKSTLFRNPEHVICFTKILNNLRIKGNLTIKMLRVSFAEISVIGRRHAQRDRNLTVETEVPTLNTFSYKKLNFNSPCSFCKKIGLKVENCDCDL